MGTFSDDGAVSCARLTYCHEVLKLWVLHAWLWKDNPTGMFSPTNPKVKCPKGVYTFEETSPKIVPHK